MKNLTTEEKVLAIADGSLSLSRIRKIYQAKFGAKIPLDTVAKICQSHGIETPRRQQPKDYFERQYPDKYTFYFIGRKLWKDVRRIWGDEAAIALKEKLSPKTLRSLEHQFAAYTDASIRNRKDIDLEAFNQSVLDWEHVYSIDTVVEQYLSAFEDEFLDNPEHPSGKEHKL